MCVTQCFVSPLACFRMGSCFNKAPQKKPVRGGGGGGDKSGGGENGRKIVLLGEMSTGKTCLVLRLVKNEFSEKELPTIGFAPFFPPFFLPFLFFSPFVFLVFFFSFNHNSAAFMVHKMPVDDKTVKLEIWDTAGQERFVCFFLSFQTHLFFSLCVFS